jgi:hypothetical protein
MTSDTENSRATFDAALSTLKSVTKRAQELRNAEATAQDALLKSFCVVIVEEGLLARFNWMLKVRCSGNYALETNEYEARNDPLGRILNPRAMYHFSFQLMGDDGFLYGNDGTLSVSFNSLEKLLAFVKKYQVRVDVSGTEASITKDKEAIAYRESVLESIRELNKTNPEYQEARKQTSAALDDSDAAMENK